MAGSWDLTRCTCPRFTRPCSWCAAAVLACGCLTGRGTSPYVGGVCQRCNTAPALTPAPPGGGVVQRYAAVRTPAVHPVAGLHHARPAGQGRRRRADLRQLADRRRRRCGIASRPPPRCAAHPGPVMPTWPCEHALVLRIGIAPRASSPGTVCASGVSAAPAGLSDVRHDAGDRQGLVHRAGTAAPV